MAVWNDSNKQTKQTKQYRLAEGGLLFQAGWLPCPKCGTMLPTYS